MKNIGLFIVVGLLFACAEDPKISKETAFNEVVVNEIIEDYEFEVVED